MKKNKLLIVVILIILILGGLYLLNFGKKPEKTKSKITKTIENYNYNLYDNSTKNYKDLFNELSKVLSSDTVDEKKYVELISKMFIIDFYTLSNKTTNMDIGGLQFVHKDVVDNFKEKATATIYKFVETNIYGDRKQELPKVKEVTIEGIEQKNFKYNKTSDSNAYFVKINWTYEKDLGYETSKNLVFVHDDKALPLVEMS